jgi:5-methylthioribose kinase
MTYNTREGIEEIVSKMLAIGWDSKLKKHDGTSIVVSFTKAELCDLLLNLEENHHQELQKARAEILHKLHLCSIGKYEGDALENVKAQIKEYQAEL